VSIAKQGFEFVAVSGTTGTDGKKGAGSSSFRWYRTSSNSGTSAAGVGYISCSYAREGLFRIDYETKPVILGTTNLGGASF